MNITAGNQIRASDMDRRIISSKISRNRKLRIRNPTETNISLKLVRTNIQKYIRHWKTVQIKSTHRRYTRLWHACLPMWKALEDILEKARNRPIGFYTQVQLVKLHQIFRTLHQAQWWKQINILKFQMVI